MTEPLRRILVALDASPESLGSVEAAAELAAAMHAELLGLFVEDLELLELATNPFARQMDLLTATLRPLERPVVERRLRLAAERARSALERTAGRRGITWSFRVRQGRVAAEIEAAAGDVDLVWISRSGWRRTGWEGRAHPPTSRPPATGLAAAGTLTSRPTPSRAATGHPPRSRATLGHTARELLERGQHTMFFHGHPPTATCPVWVALAGGPTGQRALRVAADLAESQRRPMAILLFAPDEAERQKLQKQAEQQLADRELVIEFRPVASLDRTQLAEQISGLPCGLLVLSASAPFSDTELEALIAEIACPVLVVR